jgi:hypothetical protein
MMDPTIFLLLFILFYRNPPLWNHDEMHCFTHVGFITTGLKKLFPWGTSRGHAQERCMLKQRQKAPVRGGVWFITPHRWKNFYKSFNLPWITSFISDNVEGIQVKDLFHHCSFFASWAKVFFFWFSRVRGKKKQ